MLWLKHIHSYIQRYTSPHLAMWWWHIDNCYIVNMTTKVKVSDGETLKYCLISVSYQPQKVTQMTLSRADISDWQFEAHDLLWCIQYVLYCDFLILQWLVWVDRALFFKHKDISIQTSWGVLFAKAASLLPHSHIRHRTTAQRCSSCTCRLPVVTIGDTLMG